jgi:hypothetical protein
MKELEEWFKSRSGLAKMGLVVAIGLLYDRVLTGGTVLSSLVSVSRSYETVITLAFSSALAVLYWEQHQTQKRQTAITERQVEIQERQLDLQEGKEMPSLWFNDWSLASSEPQFPGEEAQQCDRLVSLTLSAENRGSGRASNLQVDYDLYLGLEEGERVRYYKAPFRFLATREAPFTEPEEISEEMLNQSIGESIQPGEIRELSALSPVEYRPIDEQAEVVNEKKAEGVWLARRISTAPASTLGEAIDDFYFDPAKVCLEITVSYESRSGEQSSDLLTRRAAPVSEIETIDDLSTDGRWVHHFDPHDNTWMSEELNLTK